MSVWCGAATATFISNWQPSAHTLTHSKNGKFIYFFYGERGKRRPFRIHDGISKWQWHNTATHTHTAVVHLLFPQRRWTYTHCIFCHRTRLNCVLRCSSGGWSYWWTSNQHIIMCCLWASHRLIKRVKGKCIIIITFILFLHCHLSSSLHFFCVFFFSSFFLVCVCVIASNIKL